MSNLDTGAPLSSIADRLAGRAESAERMSVADMLETAGRASYGPVVLLLALITITPIGAIPGASILTGVILVVLGAQMLFGRGHLWLPSWIQNRAVGARRVKQGVAKSRPVLRRVDRLPRPRMAQFLRPAWGRAIAVGITAMGLLMFPLAFVPWGVMVPAAALLLVGLGLTGHDGLLTMAGFLATAVAAGVSVYLVFTSLGG